MQELIKKFYKGAAINTSNSLFIYLINFVISLVLMRYIGPTEFGYMAIINIFISLFFLFSELGLNNVIIQKEELSSIELNSILCYRLVLSIGMIFIFYFGSYYIENYYQIENLRFYMILCSIVLLSSSLNSVAISVSKRKMEFGKLARSQSFSIIAAGLISVVLAIQGFGIYALIVKQILPTFFMLYLFYLLKLEFNLKFDFKILKSLINRSKYFSISQIFNVVSKKLDSFFISAYLGPVDLGIYDKSHSTLLIPVNQIKSKILIALFPALSKLNAQKKDLKALVLHVSRIIASVCYPLVLFIYCLVDEFVVLFLNEEWDDLRVYVKLFCLIALIQLPTFPAYIFMVKNEMKKKVSVDWILKPLGILLSFLGIYFFGLIGVVLAYFGRVVLQSAIYNSKSSKMIGLKFIKILSNIKLHFLLAVVAILLYEIAMWYYLKTGTVDYQSLFLKCLYLFTAIMLFYKYLIRPEIHYWKTKLPNE